MTTYTITNPASIFDHTMDPVAGYDIAPGHALKYSAAMAAAVTLIPYEGRVVHLDSSGNFAMGCRANKMPMFLQQPSTPYGHLATVQALGPGGGWQAIGTYPRAALVATGGYEIETTEYDDAKTYLPNNFLTAKYSNTDQNTGGLLTNVVPGTSTALTPPGQSGGTNVTICGQVTRPPVTHKNGNKVLGLWTVYFPGLNDA